MAERLPNLPERKVVKAALRGCGLSDRQAKALLANWHLLVGESEAEVEELRDQLADLTALLEISRTPR
jgi:hypothetical protein